MKARVSSGKDLLFVALKVVGSCWSYSCSRPGHRETQGADGRVYIVVRSERLYEK